MRFEKRFSLYFYRYIKSMIIEFLLWQFLLNETLFVIRFTHIIVFIRFIR